MSPICSWSSDTNTPPQFLTVKLDRPAVVTNITFGKFEKTHVCNLKRFQVFAGVEENNLIEVLDSGLKNDSTSENFSLQHQLNRQFYPVRYVKIVPLQSWGVYSSQVYCMISGLLLSGPSFNYSVWYVALFGDDNPAMTKRFLSWHTEFREKETIRLCLKHFRQQNYLEAFESLQKKTKIQLEDPLLTDLHSILVIDGDFVKTEELIKNFLRDGVFADYIRRQQPRPVWTPLILPGMIVDNDVIVTTSCPNTTSLHTSDSVTPSVPSQPHPRGGHQVVIDVISDTIYVFGGWDGSRDLSDFWQFNIQTGKWSLLSEDTAAVGGPPPRSCHKMVLDPNFRQIFVLGRYLERGMRATPENTKSDFYVYDIDNAKWTQITDDTVGMGGPSLIFDHQMCLDPVQRHIYVFGGQTLPLYPTEERPAGSDKKFSGLFVYQIPDNTWKLLWEDGQVKTAGLPPLRSRTGHSMLFNTSDRNLYIFGGQRKKDEYMNDFLTFNVDTGTVKFLSDGNGTASSIPAVGYTQRATIDCKRNEIYVMTGLNKDKVSCESVNPILSVVLQGKESRSGEGAVSNSFWVYEISSARWSLIYKNENYEPDYWTTRQIIEPRPRYAHQLVYNEEDGLHFMFGGNPGGKDNRNGKLRLGDFWRLELERQQNTDLERVLIKEIRKTRLN